MTTAIEQTLETYGIENWGAGYFGINRKGNLVVHPSETDQNRAADVQRDHRRPARGAASTTPVLLRFPQLIAGQVRKLQRAFRNSIREYEYQGSHMCVYPMKVNQNRAVVEEYLREGSRYDFGLEAGSKAELYAALAMEQSGESLLVLNGFKDEEFIELAFLGARSGKRVVIVIEKLNELDHVLRMADRFEGGDLPMVGLRVKLYSKGSGRWEKSGGEAAKFGLTTTEILEIIRRVQEAGRIDMLKLLHFHIGSQLTDIKRIKNAMKEAARVYAKIVQMKVPIDLLDVGGGMAVDYDGSKTAFDSSANYTAQEFANDVIYTIKQVCDDENVPHPTIIQESGRYLSAYHAILVTNVLGRDRDRRRGHHAHRGGRRRSAGRHRAGRPARDDHGQELPRVSTTTRSSIATSCSRCSTSASSRSKTAPRARCSSGTSASAPTSTRSWPSTCRKSSTSCAGSCAPST